MSGVIDSIKIENGKYEIVLPKEGMLYIKRGDEVWMTEVAGSKMLIAMMYELLAARQLLTEISFDFDPDKVLGPLCGPEMLKKIKELAEQYGWKLNEEL